MFYPNKHISSHPRYGAGIFGAFGKLLGKAATKVSGEAAKKLIKKGISTAGEQASKAILKKTQEEANKGAEILINKAINKIAKSKAKSKSEPKSKVDPVTASIDIINKAINKIPKAKPVTQPVSQLSADAAINKLMAGSGNRKPKAGVLRLEDIINRGINTPFLPEDTTFGSGIKTL